MSVQRPLWDRDTPTGASRLDASVHWVCRKDAHRAAPSRGGRGGLTVHEGKWAYCDGDTRDPQHEWAPTGGVAIGTLIDWSKALEPWRARTVRP